jgi:hypothetical protein
MMVGSRWVILEREKFALFCKGVEVGFVFFFLVFERFLMFENVVNCGLAEEG